MTYWQRGKAIEDNDERLARICRTSVEQWLNVRSTIVEFFEIEDGFLVHKRIENELEKVRAKSEKARKAGIKSGKSRRQPTEKTRETNGRSTNDERTLNHTDTDTDTDDGDGVARARGSAGQDLSDPNALLEAVCAIANTSGDTNPNWAVSMECANWLRAGYDPHDDILPAVEATMARKRDGPPGSLKYFTLSLIHI